MNLLKSLVSIFGDYLTAKETLEEMIIEFNESEKDPEFILVDYGVESHHVLELIEYAEGRKISSNDLK